MVTSSTSTAVRATRAITLALLALAAGVTAVMVASVVTGLVRDGNSPLYGDPLRVPLQVPAGDLGDLPAGVTAASMVDVAVAIPDPTVGQMLLRSALDLGPAIVVVWALALLVAVVRSAALGDPFGPGNAARFRSLAVLLIAGGVALTVLRYAVLTALYSQVPAHPSLHLAAGPFAPVPAGMLLGGLVAFALAAIFADGARLRDDVEGMV